MFGKKSEIYGCLLSLNFLQVSCDGCWHWNVGNQFNTEKLSAEASFEEHVQIAFETEIPVEEVMHSSGKYENQIEMCYQQFTIPTKY